MVRPLHTLPIHSALKTLRRAFAQNRLALTVGETQTRKQTRTKAADINFGQRSSVHTYFSFDFYKLLPVFFRLTHFSPAG